jgi:RNA polymerase sigma factor (sigma-70 family)
MPSPPSDTLGRGGRPVTQVRAQLRRSARADASAAGATGSARAGAAAMSTAVSPQIQPAVLARSTLESAISTFVSAWRERVITALAGRFERDVGVDTIANAVDDAVAEAWTSRWLADEILSGRANHPGRAVSAFVQRRASARLIDYIRRLGARAAPVHGLAADVVEQVLDRRNPDAAEIWVGREAASQLREALAALDEEAQQVLMLRHVENYERRRIAEVLGLTERQVKRHLERASKRLYEQYQRVEAGETCAEERLVVCFAFELVGGRDATRLKAHIGHCAACRRRHARAQAYRRAVAGLVPFPLAGDVAAPAASILDGVRGFVARLLGDGAAGAGGLVKASSAKIAAICAVGVVAGGGIYGAVNGSARHDHKAPAAVRSAQTAATERIGAVAAAPASPSPSSSLEHAQVVRAAARERAVVEQHQERRGRARRAHKAAKRPAAPAPVRSTDEFFSSSATPSGSPTPGPSPSVTANSPSPAQSAPKPSSISPPDEFAAP